MCLTLPELIADTLSCVKQVGVFPLLLDGLLVYCKSHPLPWVSILPGLTKTFPLLIFTPGWREVLEINSPAFNHTTITWSWFQWWLHNPESSWLNMKSLCLPLKTLKGRIAFVTCNSENKFQAKIHFYFLLYCRSVIIFRWRRYGDLSSVPWLLPLLWSTWIHLELVI